MSESRTSPFEGVISKTAAATAAGLLALTLAGKSEQNYAYAASAEPNEELAVDRDPLLERFDREILGITKEVKYLVKIDAPGTYKDKLTLPNGQKLDRLSVAVKNGRGGYTQIVVYMEKGETFPSSVATVFNAPRVRFRVGTLQNEPFDRIRAWLPNPGDNDNYLLADIYRDGRGGWVNKYWEKNGPINTYRVNSNRTRRISQERMAAQLDSFTSQQERVLSYVGKTLPNP